MDVFVVLSMDMGNIPLGVYDSPELANAHSDSIRLSMGLHACVAKFQMNQVSPNGPETIVNVYDV